MALLAVNGPLLVTVIVKVTLLPTFGEALFTFLLIRRSASQYSVPNVKDVICAGPPQGFGIAYCTTTLPKPVNVNVLPDNVAGPLSSDKVPPDGVGTNRADDPIQYCEVGPVAITETAISGDPAPHITIGEVLNV